MTDHKIGRVDELAPGERFVVEVDGLELGVFNLDGEFRVYLNFCAHQGGPLCEGAAVGTVQTDFDRDTLTYSYEWVRDGEIIVCPWHNWEFDLITGECLSKRDVRVPEFPVSIDDGEIIVSI